MAIEMDEGFKKLYGVAEATGTLVTGMATAPVAGVVGLSKLISGKLGITDDDAESAAKTIEAISTTGTYTPKTAEGQQYLQATMGYLEYLGVPAEKVGDFFAGAARQLGGDADTQAATGAIAEAVIDPVDKIFPGLKAAGAAAAFGVVGDAMKMGRSQADIMRALNLKTKGSSPEEIFKETKLYQGADGKWRSVISDVDYKIKKTANMAVDPITGKARLLGDSNLLPDVIDHPELFNAFPFLRDVKILGVSRPFGDMGGYLRDSKTILVSDGNPQQMQSTILHEIQHAIQENHNLAGGSSPTMFYPDHLKNLDEQIVAAASERRKWEAALEAKGYRSHNFFDAYDEIEYTEYIDADRKFSDLYKIKRDAEKDYLRTMGEVESRMVQDNWKYETKQGRDPNRIPTKDMKIPFEKQVRSPGDYKRIGPISAIEPTRFVNDFPEFKGSQIVDEFGRLKPVYHGTVNQIQGAFRFAPDSSGQLGIHFGDKMAASDRTVSQRFMRDLTRQGDPNVPEALPNTHQVYLNIQRPVRLTDKGYWDSETVIKQLENRHDITPLQQRIIEQYKIDNPLWRQGSNGGPSDSSVRKLIQKLGYDGVVYQNLYEGFGDADSYIALDPKQIRSAVSGRIE